MHTLDIFTAPWVLSICIVLFAAFMRGVAGFGFALILAPIMLLIIEPTTTVVINLFLGLLSNVLVLSYSFKGVDLKKISPMIIGCALGIPIGARIINIIPSQTLKVLIGGVTVVCAVPLAIGFTKTLRKDRLFSGVAGFFSGILSSSTSLGGPPVVLFMHSQDWKKEIIHPSLAAYFSFLNLWSIIALYISGLIQIQMILSALSLAPALLIGTGAGIIVFRKINVRYFRWFSLAVIICSGVLGILSGTGVF
ncbi:sulfite exporter TauE/SafE family protein [Chloroflexota bacterium]